LLNTSTLQNTYLGLMAAHLPLLAAAAVGICVLGWRSSALNRFGFLSKAIETIGTAGVYSIAGGIFVGLTAGMFAALGINLSDVFVRLLVAGGAGLIPVIAVASVYDPQVSPSEQDFRRGFGKILTILMRALLPLTLLVLVIYLVVIPFNFAQPYTNRDVLIIYNVMLFAIMGLLIGVTPVSGDDLSPRWQPYLRAGICLLAGLVTLVSLYALSAVLYRTMQGQLTLNRLTILGWNCINIALLVILLAKQLRAERSGWIASLHSTFRVGTIAYVAWAAIVVLVLPWLF
jgi:hypothetical protein